MTNVNVPVLMYHEIIGSKSGDCQISNTAEHYNIRISQFRNQLRFLSDNNFKSVLLNDDDFYSSSKQNKVLITFDDGWAGNWYNALSVLLQFQYKAVFFITCNYIDTKSFMTWDQIKELAGQGMMIQSHAMTHRPLELLNPKEIYQELYQSKRMIEDKIGNEVSAVSFPHGCYNRKILKIAEKVGYKKMFTSDFNRTYSNDFLRNPALLGRITMRSDMSDNTFSNLVHYNNSKEYFKTAIIKNTKNSLKRLIGFKNYHRLYKKIYSVTKS